MTVQADSSLAERAGVATREATHWGGISLRRPRSPPRRIGIGSPVIASSTRLQTLEGVSSYVSGEPSLPTRPTSGLEGPVPGFAPPQAPM